MLLALLSLLLATHSAEGTLRKVAPGSMPTLAADEGLLLAAVDTTSGVDFVRLRRDGALLDSVSMSSLQQGETAQLYVATAGSYRWDLLRTGHAAFDLAGGDYGFEVRPGVLNYPGHLVHRPGNPMSSAILLVNRGLMALDWLESNHAATMDQYAFEYTGHYPDPFPAFYRGAKGSARVAGSAGLAATPSPGTLPIDVETLWKPGRVGRVSISPDGTMLALVLTEGTDDQSQWVVELFDLEGERSHRVFVSPQPIGDLAWSGSQSLVVSVGPPWALDVVFVLRMERDAAGKRSIARLNLPVAGTVVDVLADDPDHILFASTGFRNRKLVTLVHRLDIRSKKSLASFRPKRSTALNRELVEARGWFADRAGALRMAVVERDGAIALLHGETGAFREVFRFDDQSEFEPHQLSADGTRLYGLAQGRDNVELVEFDLATAKLRTRHVQEGADVHGALFDSAGELVGVSYMQGGHVVHHYFDDDGSRVYARLRKAFPDRSVRILGRDSASSNFVLAVGGSDQPDQIFHLDLAEGRASLIESTRPWLDDVKLSPAHVVRTTSADGFQIEAFLTLPVAGDSRLPLVLYPHGGPIGVMDARHFDPSVQFIASLGYAVLQVNFRGSGGYGRAFLEAGRRGQGTTIEDDVDATLAAVLAQHPIDPQRMCAVGESYGGYSALISAIRWPERFRCVAAFAGVTDRLLFFTASDSGRSEKGRKVLEEMVGDPAVEADAMQKHSPLYRYREIAAQVMLSHGSDDARVDFEHSRRLARMLAVAGRPPVMLPFAGEGHGLSNIENTRRHWEAVAGFLRLHLQSTASAADVAPGLPQGASLVNRSQGAENPP